MDSRSIPRYDLKYIVKRKGDFCMKKVALVIMALTMVFLCVACGTGKKEVTSTQFIVVTDGSMDADAISKETVDALKSADKNVSVEEVKLSEENKYLVTISTTIAEDEVVSMLKEKAWAEKVSVNHELIMY